MAYFVYNGVGLIFHMVIIKDLLFRHKNLLSSNVSRPYPVDIAKMYHAAMYSSSTRRDKSEVRTTTSTVVHTYGRIANS